MKTIISTISFALLLLSCNSNHPSNSTNDNDSDKQEEISNDCKKEISDIVQNLLNPDPKKGIEYFNFPLESGEWYVASAFNPNLDNYDKKSFSKDDFQKYKTSLFNADFFHLLEDIDSEELLLHGQAYSSKKETRDSKGNGQSFYCKAIYSNGSLRFEFDCDFYEENEKYETQVIYYFTVGEDCNVTYDKVDIID